MKEKIKTITKKAGNELLSIALTTLYFAVWFVLLMILKKIILIDYQIHFVGLSTALIGALIMAKVVLIMQYIEFEWIKKYPPIADIAIRTFLYTLGALAVLLLEKAFEARDEYSGFGSALEHIFQHRDIYKVWASTLIIAVSLFWFNVFSILQQYLKHNEIKTLLFKTPLEEIHKFTTLRE